MFNPNFNPNFLGNIQQQLRGGNQYSTSQRIQMVEALCEGPVWGLTEGSASVYFNNTRAIEPEDATFFATRDISAENDSEAFSFQGQITFSGSSNTGSISPSAPEDTIGTYDEESSCLISVVHTRVDNATISNITYRAPSQGALIGTWSATLTSSVFNGNFDTKGFDNTISTVTYLMDDAGNFVLGTVTDNGNGTASVVYFSPLQTFNNSQSIGLTFSALVNVEEITENSIQLLTSDTPDSGTYDYSVTKRTTSYNVGGTIAPGVDEAKTENLNVQFVNGSAVQSLIRTWGGAGGGINIPNSTTPSQTSLPQLKASVAETEGLNLYSTSGYQEGRTNSENGASAPVVITTDLFPAQQRELIRAQADVVSFEIKYPRLQALDTEEGGEKENTAIYTVDIAFQDEENGSFTQYYSVFGNVVHTANFGAPLSWQHFIDIGKYRKERGGFHDFKIRVARLTRHIDNAVTVTGADYTGDDVDRYDQNDSTSKVSNIIATVKDYLYYPYTSVAGVSFSSTQFDRIPKLSYDMRGRLVKVPTSYTPREYTEDGVAVYEDWWEGDFKDQLQFTDNPAWVFYDILTNTRYGLGEYIDPDLDIDKYALYRVARYCDELVDDGNGGTEPRFRANLFLTKAEEAYKVLKDMATIFRGILFWMDGQLTPILDAPSDPVYTFTKGNVINGEFAYQTSGHKTKANQVIVTWNDPNLNYEPVPLIVEDRNAIVKQGRVNKITATAFGCTSEGQAIRYGRWKLWTAQNQTEVVSFQTSLSAAYLRPGDIINVQDADRFGKILSGRTNASTNNTITLDRDVTLVTGATYTLNTIVTEPAAYNIGNSVTISSVGTVPKGEKITRAWIDTDENDGTSGRTLRDINTAERASNAWTSQTGGSLISISWKPFTHVEEHEVTTSAGTTNTLTIDDTFTSNPGAQTVWALRETLSSLETYNSTRQYRVLSVGQEEDTLYNIAAVEYYPEKYLAVEVDYELGQVPDNIFAGEGVQVPSCQYLISREIDNTNAKTRKLSLFWEAPEDFDFVDYYELKHNIPNIESPIQIRRGETSFEFSTVPQGIYRFSIRVVTPRGNKSSYVRTFHQTGLNNSTDAAKIGELYAGGSATSLAGIVNSLQDGQYFRFEDETYTLAPPQALGVVRTNNPTNTLSLEQSLSKMVGPDYVATSSTSHTINTGSKTFTLASMNSLYSVGMELKITSEDEENNYFIGNITSIGTNSVTVDVTLANGTGNSDDWTLNRNGYSTEEWDYEESENNPLAYIFVDTSRVSDGSADCLKLVSRRLDDSGVYMFEDVDDSTPWTNINGTCTIDGLTSKVVGTNTAFTSDLEVGSFIRFTDSAAARVTFIRNDTELYIDSVFDETIEDETTQKNSLSINRARDFLLGSVIYDTSTGEFSFDQFYTISELGIQRQLILDSETAYLLYNDLNEADQQPPEINIRALAIGYTKPKFKMTWTTTDLAGGDAQDTEFQSANYPSGNAPDGGNKQEYTKKVFEEASADPTDNIQYGDGTALVVTCTALEAEDPDNLKKQRTATWTIAKLKRQASGNLARVVKLTAEDYSIVYDAEGSNPSYQGSADSDIDLTASTGGFNEPLFRFTLDGTVYEGTSGQPWSETSTVPFTPPASVDSFGTSGGGTKTMLVEVAEKPSGWSQSAQTPSIGSDDIAATDSISILGVKTGGSGVFISFSNETHAVACDSEGEPLVEYGNAISGSGTTIEVFVNGSAYEFTTGTPSAGEFAVSITDNADITEGSITGNGTNIATVADHAFGANSEDQELLEYTITVGGIADDGTNLEFTKFQSFAKSKGGTAGASTSLVYLYKAASSDPSSTTANLDNVVVDLTTGKIDTTGGDTKFEEGDSGWYTTPSGPTVASNQVLWVVAATANGSGLTEEIEAGEWSDAAEFSGESPLNTAIVELFLVNNVATTPDRPDTDVTYTFADGTITGTPGNGWSSTASSISISNKYLWKTTAAAISQAATTTIDGTDGNDGTDWSTPVLVGFFGEGSNGEDAVAVKLTSPDYSIVYNEYDVPSPTGTITLTAEAQNLTTPWFKFTGDGISDDSAFASANTKTFTIPTTPFTTPKNIQVEVSDGSSTQTQQTRLALDTISIAGISSASDGYTVVNTNSAHTIPVSTGDTDGSTGDYDGSGTAIEVYKGSTQLTPVAASVTPTTGQFNVTATGNNITKGDTESVSTSTKQYTIDEASAMTAATASISYAINVENLETLTSIQTFSKSFEGVAGQDNKQLALGVDHNTFVRQKAGTISPSAIKFTANKINIGTGSPSWSTNPSNVDLFAAATGGSAIDKSTFTGDAVYVRPSAFALSTIPNSVSVTANLVYNSVTYTDTESIELLTEASDEITVVLTNDNVSIPANKNGVASSYASTGTTISVFEGSYRLDYDGTGTANEKWTVTATESQTGGVDDITVGAISESSGNSKNAVVANASAMPNARTAASITFNISGKKRDGTAFTATKVQTFSKINTGQDGNTGESVNIIFGRFATAPTAPADSASPNNSIGWYDNPPSDNGNPLYASRGTKAVGATVFDWGTPYRVDGDSVAEVYIYSDVVTGDSEDVPTGSTYDFTSNTLTINDSNWNKNPPSLSSDGDRVYVAVGLATGTPGSTAASVTFGDAALFAEKTDGSPGNPSKLVDLNTTKYALDYTSAGTRSTENLTLTANTQNFTNPVYKFTGGGSAFTNETSFKTGNTATFAVPTAFSATPYNFQVEVKESGAANSTALTDSITIFSFKATNKQKTVFIFKRDDNTVGFATGKTAADQTYANPTSGLESGWSEDNPGLASTNGAKVYMSKRIFTDDGLDPQESAWSTPAIVAQRDDGNNTAVAEIFVLSDSSTSAPATGFVENGSGDNLTYNFSQAKITSTVPGDYSATAGSVSSSTPYLWKRTAPASSASNTVTIAYDAWSSGVLIGSFGDEGDPGDRSKNIRLYATSTATSDSSTGAASLNYADDADRGFNTTSGAAVATNLTSSSGLNWQTTSPNPTTSLNVLIAEAVVTQTNSTGSYAKSDGWDISLHAAKIAEDGDRSKTVKLYQLNTSTTATAPGNTEGFNTTTGVAAAITGWAVSPPAPTTTQNVLVAEGVVTQANATGSYTMTQDWTVSVHAAKVAESIPGDDQGAVKAYGGGGTVTWDNSQRAWALAANGDNTTGAAWPAFAVNSSDDQKWSIECEVKASSSGATSGLYVRMQELDGSLNAGKTHISNNSSNSDSLVQEDTRQVTVGVENQAVGNDWTKISFTYTPTSTANFVSLSVLNWSGLGTRTLYVRNIKRVVKGPDGADGDRSKTVKLYLRAASTPSAPGNNEGFNTTSGASATIQGSWNVNPPTPTTTQNVYVAEGIVTQTNGTGTYSMTQSWVVSVHAAKQATNGTSGFFYITRSDSGTTTNTAGTDLGAPSSTEFPNPTAGQIAIVQNSVGNQQGWLRGSNNAWSTQQIVNQEIIFANAIGANQMQISNNEDDSGDAGIFLDYNNGNSRITISDSTRVRVKIGYLGS